MTKRLGTHEIRFGALFDGDTTFPWDEGRYDGDVTLWWLFANGFRRSFEMFNDEGDWLNGIPPIEVENAYYDEEDAFERSCPLLPFALTKGTVDKKRYSLLFVPDLGTNVSATGYSLLTLSGDELASSVVCFIASCKKHRIELPVLEWHNVCWDDGIVVFSPVS